MTTLILLSPPILTIVLPIIIVFLITLEIVLQNHFWKSKSIQNLLYASNNATII